MHEKTGLDPCQLQELNGLLAEFRDVLSDKIGLTHLTDCKLEVRGEPIAQKPYRVSPFKRSVISEHVRKMLKDGIIRESTSEYASPVNFSSMGTSGSLWTIGN